MKSLREYRILLKKDDGVEISFFKIGHNSLNSHSDNNYNLYDISSSGVGIKCETPLKTNEVYNISISYKSHRFDTVAKVVHSTYSRSEKDIYIVGLEFQDQDNEHIEKFIKNIISGMSKDRKRSLMYEILKNEGLVLNYGMKDIELSSSILLDLFTMFSKYSNSYGLMYLFLEEVKRKIGAEDFRFYRIDDDSKNISVYDFSTGEISSNYFPIIGVMKEVYEKGITKNSRLSKKLGNDAFYKMFNVVNNIEIDTYLLAPVYDKNGIKLGIIEFSNKENKEVFNEQDIKEVKILSFILGITFSMDFNFENEKYAKKLKAFYNEGTLIGPSEQNRYLNSFISESASHNDPILISGEFGVGKKLIGVIIHEKSKRSNHTIGHINCHNIDDIQSINKVFNSDQYHVGYKEQYSGGTIIIKDINFLGEVEQKELYKQIMDSSDIRFIATSTMSFEVLSHEPWFNKDLLEYFSKKHIRIPSLRERPEDIVPLTHFFAYESCVENNLTIKNISSDVINIFQSYDWPGNVSELKIAIDRLISLQTENNLIKYKRIKTVPIVDRDLGSSLNDSFGLNFEIVINNTDITFEDFEELYFYFYVTDLIDKKGLSFFDVSELIDMPIDNIKEKLFVSAKKVENYFGVSIDSVNEYLEKSA
ncbi:MAG: sigma 54-interacting transcriptional regulator [Bdellovibrionota bacterium]|nr:sigma 54-interacting transcriptional regulator [Bdellovibrionota bacterium]